MDIYMDRVKIEQKNILYRLLEYSLFEESLNDGNEMNENALFEYKYFDSYFQDESRDAFFIRESKTSKLLGFVMINQNVQKVDYGHSIAEYMIIPKYRKRNIGKKAAFECFDMYKGNWEVSLSYGSTSAYQFWKKVIEEYTKNNYTYSDSDRIFSFSSKKNCIIN